MKLIKISERETKEMSFEDTLKQYEPFIFKITKSWYKLYEKEDLLQVSKLGLLKAYEKYDIATGYTFLTYAGFIISNELKMYNRTNYRHINTFSLNDTFSDKEGTETEFIDTLECEVDYEDIALEKLVINEIREVLEGLKDKSKDLIIDSFLNNMTQMQIADKYGMQQASVSRSIRRGLNRIKNKIA